MNNEMANINFPVPLLKEQQNIANYLDEKCYQVESIIEKSKQAIEEYKKYKESLITETVTKGLDKNVPMKDSGVEWIGEVPEGWDTIKLKYVFEIVKNISGKLGYDVLSVTQKGLKVKDIKSNQGQIAADYSKYQIVEKDDFVMNHMDLLTGWVDCSVFEGVTSPDYRVFRLIKPSKNSKRYFKYIMQICYSNKIFFGLGQGVSNLGRWRLQTDKFINFELPLVSFEEQKAIVNFLDKKCSEIDSIVLQKEKLIEELETYKKALIYECVTGKREVVQ